MQTPRSQPPRSPLHLRRLGLTGWIGIGLVVILFGVVGYIVAPTQPQRVAGHAQIQH